MADMDNQIFEKPILNSPYAYPLRHAEFTEVYQIESDFEAKVRSEFDKMLEHVVSGTD